MVHNHFWPNVRLNIRFAAIVAVSLGASGCHAIFGTHQASVDSVNARPIDGASDAMAPATQAGRTYLNQGQLGLAVEAFQRALATGEPMAPALNGMGVAYAEMGRFDTAEHLFQGAMAMDSSDGRYAANLARLSNQRSLTEQRYADANTKQSEALASAENTVSNQTAQSEPGKLVRVSRNEYKIRTIAPEDAHEAPRMATVSSDFKPLVRMDLDKVGAKEAAPVRKLVVLNPYARPEGKSIPGFRPIVRMTLPDATPAKEPSGKSEADGEGAAS